jgi:hypothetical protein
MAGEFMLTGSHQFELNRRINQSLAGRTAILNLLPLSIAELHAYGAPCDIDRLLYADGLDPCSSSRWSPPSS